MKRILGVTRQQGWASQADEMQVRMSPEEVPSDRRGGRRMRTLKGGRAIFNGGYSSFECTVRNLSDGGAVLVFGDILGIPNHFELEIGPGQPRRSCTVRWREGTAMGVSFDGH